MTNGIVMAQAETKQDVQALFELEQVSTTSQPSGSKHVCWMCSTPFPTSKGLQIHKTKMHRNKMTLPKDFLAESKMATARN